MMESEEKDVDQMNRTALAGIMAAFKLRGAFNNDIRRTLVELKEEFNVNDEHYLHEFRRICHDEDVDRLANNALGARLSWLHESQLLAVRIQKRRKKQSRLCTKKYYDNLASTRARRPTGFGPGTSQEGLVKRQNNFFVSNSDNLAPSPDYFNLQPMLTASSAKSKRKRRLSTAQELKKRKEKLHLQASLRACSFRPPPRPTTPGPPFAEDAAKKFAESLSRVQTVMSERIGEAGGSQERGEDEQGLGRGPFIDLDVAAVEADGGATDRHGGGGGAGGLDDGDGLVRLASALRNAEDLRKGWAVEAIANRLFRQRFSCGFLPFLSTAAAVMPPLCPIPLPSNARRRFSRRRRVCKRVARGGEEEEDDDDDDDEENSDENEDCDIGGSETPENLEHVAEDLTFAAFPGVAGETVEESIVEDPLLFGPKSSFMVSSSTTPDPQLAPIGATQPPSTASSSSSSVYYNLDPANLGFLLHHTAAAAANFAFGMAGVGVGVEALPLLDPSACQSLSTPASCTNDVLDLSTSSPNAAVALGDVDQCGSGDDSVVGQGMMSLASFLPVGAAFPVAFPCSVSPEVSVSLSD